MGGPKPTLGYPSRTAAAIALRAAGLSTKEIASRIGVAPATVVSLEISGRRAREARPPDGVRLVIPQAVLDALDAPARRRGLTAGRLAVRILRTVVLERLVDAVLDDGEELSDG